MQSLSVQYDDLEQAIDDVRQLLDEWLDASGEAPMSSWKNPAFDYTAGSDHRETGPDPYASSNDTGSNDTGRAASDEPSDQPLSEENADSPAQPGLSNGVSEPRSSGGLDKETSSSSAGEADPALNGRPSIVRYLQVVLHEWLANLIQHARFRETEPHVEITIRMDRRYISCFVADNSTGFNLSKQLEIQRNEARALPERGMGLRIISACTEQCEYRSLDDGRHRFEFSIPVDHEPWLSTLF